jgi:cysteine desulfurase
MPIYLDNNATTALDPEFLPAIMENLNQDPINPSSFHALGQKGKMLISETKQVIANYLFVKPHEITFTSGGTESLNSLIMGVIKSQTFDCILTTKIEHACVYETVLELQRLNYPVVFLDVKAGIDLMIDQINTYSKGKKCCLILSSVNSETGSMIPLKEIADLAQKNQITFLVDGVAQLGKCPIKIYPGISGLGFSSHKIHALKGTGFFYLKDGVKFQKLLFGGPQERNKRPGTENTLAILSLKLAIEKIQKNESAIIEHLESLKSTFIKTLKTLGCEFSINGLFPHVSNTVNCRFHGVDGETLLIALDQKGVYCSMGAACASGALEPSRVLIEMGYEKAHAKESIRFSFSRFNTLLEVEIAAKVILQTVSDLKNLFVKKR